ncbi:MAG: Gfo/Idh/MocA family oxidoreductase [Clostridia bacterium]|nr:Gfo/Idh/MocA family oxidoreductase [Clostridia bacterium]
MKKVCFIGACGHWKQAYHCLKKRQDLLLCGFAPGSAHEKLTKSISPDLPFFANYETMLDTVKPDLAIVSPVFGLTGQVILACAKRQIDVFAEKPIAATFEELDHVRASVLQSGIRFCAMHYLRYDPAFYHGAKLVRQGKIGKLKMITAQKSYQYGVRPDWYGDRSLYCGTIPWVGIHAIDWISDFTGRRFQTVTAQSVGENPEMAALCQFTLDGDIIASANIDFYRPESAPTHGDDRIRCVGTEGVLEVCRGNISLMNKDGVFEFRPNTAPELLTEFLDDGECISTDEIFHIAAVALAAKQSAELGKTTSMSGQPISFRQLFKLPKIRGEYYLFKR